MARLSRMSTWCVVLLLSYLWVGAGCSALTATHTQTLFIENDRRVDATGQLVNGRKEGAWTLRDPVSNQLIAKGSYRRGRAVGLWIYLYPNGQKKQEGLYRDGVKQGIWSSWYDNGKLKAQGRYADGVREGQWRRWDRLGQKREEGWYRVNNRAGAWQFWDARGRRTRRGRYVEGTAQGLWLFWHPNGKKAYAGRFKNGLRHAKWMHWHDNGKVAWRGEFIADRPHQFWSFWYPNGALRYKGRYTKGRRYGMWQQWYDNGTLQVQADFVGDNLTGNWFSWYDTGQQHTSGRFKFSRPFGQWLGWHQNARQAFEAKFDQGVRFDRWTWWYENGQMSVKGDYYARQRAGVWSTWYPTGDRRSVIQYGKGKPMRTRTVWRKDGTISKATGSSYLKPEYNTSLDVFDEFFEYCRRSASPLKTSYRRKRGAMYKGKRAGNWIFDYTHHQQTFARGQFYQGAPRRGWTFYDASSGRRCVSARFERGYLHGKVEFLSPVGVVEQRRWYHYGQRVGLETILHPHRTIHQQGQRTQNRRYGYWLSRLSDGRLYNRTFYARGWPIVSVDRPDTRLNVTFHEVQDDRVVRASGPLVRLKRHGVWFMTDLKTDARVAYGKYTRGLRSSTWRFWYPNGVNRRAGAYRLGRKHQFWVFWRPDGMVDRRGFYNRASQRHGVWTVWDQQTGKKSFRRYKLGVLKPVRE